MHLLKNFGPICIVLQLCKVLALEWNCVAKAQLSCEAETAPENSWEKDCIDVDPLDWTNPVTRDKSECFCGDDGKAVLKRYFDCFYERAFQCPNRSEGFATSFMVWVEESCYHRGKRRLYCNDDWKPTPPWDKIKDNDVKRYYNLSSPHQYSFDNKMTARGIPWHGCRPEDPRDGFGPGWP